MEDTFIVPVKYVDGKYVAGLPQGKAIAGPAGKEFSQFANLEYICAEPLLPQYTKNPGVQVETGNEEAWSRDQYKFEMQSIYNDKTIDVRVNHEVWFQRPEGHTKALLDYICRWEVTELSEPTIPPGLLYATVPSARTTLYLSPGKQIFGIVIEDNYAGYDDRELSIRDFSPANETDKSDPLIGWDRLSGNVGLQIKADLKKETSYSLVIQHGDDSSADEFTYLWISTRMPLIS